LEYAADVRRETIIPCDFRHPDEHRTAALRCTTNRLAICPVSNFEEEEEEEENNMNHLT
jgi:hypothetical protein